MNSCRVACLIALTCCLLKGTLSDVSFLFSKESSLGYSLIRELSSGSQSDDCATSSRDVLEGLKSGSLKESSFRMMDSSGYFGPGLLNGNPHILGDYEECLSIEAGNYRGQFITALSPYLFEASIKNFNSNWEDVIRVYQDMDVLPMESLARHKDYGLPWNETVKKESAVLRDLVEGFILQKPIIGLCVPSTCDVQTLQKALMVTVDKFIDFTSNGKLKKSPVKYYLTNLNYVRKEGITLSFGDILAIALLVAIGVCTAVGTTLDAFLGSTHSKHKYMEVIICFSLIRNYQSLLSVEGANKGIGSLNSLRFLSTIWIILGHTWYIYTSLQQPKNLFSMADFYGDWTLFPLFGGASYPSVDTFFVIGGFLTSYVTLKKLDKSRGSLNVFQAFIHRYIRLTPVYAILIFFGSTLILHLGEGPFWNLMLQPTQNCIQNWWTNLLYINNFVKPELNCMKPAWYLACDFQLYLLGICISWILWNYETLGKVALALLLLTSCVIPGALTYVNEWGPVNTVSFRAPYWGDYFYQMTYTRASPYFYGMLFGYLIYKMKNKEIKLTKLQLIAGWILSVSTLLSITYGFIDEWALNAKCTQDRGCFSVFESLLFASLGRLAWGVAISWIVFVCHAGYGGVINKLLAHPIFLPLNRLSYVLYLVHFNVIAVFLFSRKDILRFDMATMVYHFFGHTGVSLIISFFISLFIEWPFYGLEKILFESLKTDKKIS